MTRDLILYANPRKQWHSENVRWFADIIRDYPSVSFYNPSVESPWHVKAVVNGIDMNFWPCAGKANMEFNKAVYGPQAVRSLLDSALDFQGGNDDFDVLEDL